MEEAGAGTLREKASAWAPPERDASSIECDQEMTWCSDSHVAGRFEFSAITRCFKLLFTAGLAGAGFSPPTNSDSYIEPILKRG